MGGCATCLFSGPTGVSCTLLTVDDVMTLSLILMPFAGDPFPADSMVDLVITESFTVDPPLPADFTVEPVRTASFMIFPCPR